MSAQPVKTGKKLSPTQIILIVGIILILAAIAVVGWLALSKAKPAQPVGAVPGNGNLVADENVEDAIAAMRQKAAEGMFEVKMSPTWSFPEGTTQLSPDAYVANSTANHKPIYFEITTQEGDVLYTSPKIPLGSAVKDITLTEKLDPGEHECVCKYYLLNEDDTIFTTASVVVRLQVAK